MRIGVVSDIHSNYTALQSALEALGPVDALFFLGDYISDGYQDNEVVDCVRKYGDVVIKGNRDQLMTKDLSGTNMQPLQWTRTHLRKDHLDYLESLPSERIVTYEGIRFLLLHGDHPPLDRPYYPSFDVIIENYDFDVCITGHIHRYFDITYRGKRFVNASSVGLPDDGPSYKFLSIDIDETVTIHCHQLKVLDTFTRMQDQYRQSAYFKANPVWGSLVLESIRVGKNLHETFLPIMIKEITDDSTQNVWQKAYELFEKARQIDGE